MVRLEKVYANYLCRKFVVVSSVSLHKAIDKFYELKRELVFTTDNFFDVGNLSKIGQEIKGFYYKPKFGFLGKIEQLKDFCNKNRIVFIEDFTDNFSANKIINGKSLYAGMFGDVSICVRDNVFFYATDDEKLAGVLRSAAGELEIQEKKKLIDSLFEVEVEKRRRQVAAANYTVLISYLRLSQFLKPIDEDIGEAASYPVFAVTAKKLNELHQYLAQIDVRASSWNDLLLLPTDVTNDELEHIIDLISEFYKGDSL